MNHHRLLETLTKGLSQIAGALPRIQLSALLFPTDAMKLALAEIYAAIIQFLVRANEWFKESRLLRVVHSFTRPTELRYDDVLQDIETATKNFESIAITAAHAEQRDMHLLMLEIKQTLYGG